VLATQQDACVAHVVAPGDTRASETLRRTTLVIAEHGVDQVLLPVEGLGLPVLHRVRALQAQLDQLFRERAVYAVHFHGLAPCLLGSGALQASALRARVLCSPHRAHFGPYWAAALLGRVLQSRLAPFDHAPLAASPAEAPALSRLLRRSAEVLPHPVGAAFFDARREEGAAPGVLARGSGAASVAVVCRLSVLLNGREPRIAFGWTGAAAPGATLALEAAQVRLAGAADDVLAAQALARAWLFVDVSPSEGLPLAVAQAMAAGVPCLVSDTPEHRAMVRHGETGFLCASERDFLETAVLLLRDRAERERVGAAARAEAGRRFTERDFRRAVLRAYRFPLAAAPRLAVHPERIEWKRSAASAL
jgi:hypothetical protein